MAMDLADTLPKLLKRNYETWAERRVALRDKNCGLWQEYTWKDYYENVRRLALGFKSLGLQRGDKVCLLGDNEPEWYWGELACQAMGAVAVGLFPDCSADEAKYVVGHSNAVLVLARDQEQTDKILQVHGEIPGVKKTIYWAPMGMWDYHDSFITSFEQVQRLGDEYEKRSPGYFEEEVERGQGDDLALLGYTSGTTGPLKGCMVTHKNLTSPVREWMNVNPWHSTDNYFSFFSPAWIMEQFFGLTASLVSGAAVNFPEGPETVQDDIREIGPSIVLYNFKIWESLCSTIQARIEGSFPIKRALFHSCLSLGYKKFDLEQKGKTPSLGDRLLYGLANRITFRPLRDKTGLLHTRYAYTGGAAMSPGAFRFLRAVGIPLRQIYGSSETGVCCYPPDGENLRGNSIGLPLPGVEITIGEGGELLVEGNGLFAGYHREDERTARVLVDGWYHSDDAVQVDEEGYLVYLDRMADMVEVEGQARFPSQNIESTLRFSPYIREAIVLISGRVPYVAVLIQIDLQAVAKWADRQRIAYTTFADLSQKPQVYDLVEKEIRVLNLGLPEAAQVKKFACLPKELDPDDGELTRDRKLRKNFLRDRYRELLAAIYAGKETFPLTSPLKAGNESAGAVQTSVSIRTLT